MVKKYTAKQSKRFWTKKLSYIPRRAYSSLSRWSKRKYKRCVRRGGRPVACYRKVHKVYAPRFKGTTPIVGRNYMVMRSKSEKGTIWYDRFQRPNGIIPNMTIKQFEDTVSSFVKKKINDVNRKYKGTVKFYVYDPAHGTYDPIEGAVAAMAQQQPMQMQ